MSGLNYLCLNDTSDEDRYFCRKYRYIYACPCNCPDFDDARESMTDAQKALRKEIMEKNGIVDKLPWE